MSNKKQTLILAVVIILASCLLFGLSSWLSGEGQPVDEKEHSFATNGSGQLFVTNTPTSTLAGNGWWNAMPTDPDLPTMPPISLRTPTPTRTPNTRTQTAIALTGTTTPTISITPER